MFSYFTYQEEIPAPTTSRTPGSLDKKFIKIGNNKLTVEIADQPEEQSQGLSDRNSLGQNEGMLFVFPRPLVASFWMKEMLISLDMIWIDENKTIIGIQKYVSPDTFPKTFGPPSPVKYVLEVNAGWSDINKIKIGDKMVDI